MDKEKATDKGREPLTIEALEQVTGGSGIADSEQPSISPDIYQTVKCRSCGNEYGPTSQAEYNLGLCPNCRQRP